MHNTIIAAEEENGLTFQIVILREDQLPLIAEAVADKVNPNGFTLDDFRWVLETAEEAGYIDLDQSAQLAGLAISRMMER